MKKVNNLEIVDVMIDAVIRPDIKRFLQLYNNGEIQDNYCVHGTKLRWSCDECEELIEKMELEL